MKIDILTFSFAINRGAHMQCYALQTVLHNMGHQVEVIHIELPSKGLSLKGKIDKYILNRQNKNFRKKYYRDITDVYYSAEELRKNPPIADVYIVGSDQVWNPSITKGFGIESFFLDFVPDGCKKIAYAASFGSSIWTSLGKEKDNEIQQLIKQFNAVSVRELDGVEICEKEFGRKDVCSVIDPVFLLNDYSQIISDAIEDKNQVLCYPLYSTSEIKNVFLEISKDLGMTPVSFSRSIRGENIKLKIFSSIPTWLKTIYSSKFIVTNSFHCMAFCILFHKKFIVLPPYPGKESRMISMLKQLGIEDRYVKSMKDFEERKDLLYNDIEYDKVDEKLNILRQNSLRFIINNL